VHPTAGPSIMTAIPVEFTKSPGSVRRPPPTLGEHTRAVLGELGYDDAAIDDASGRE